MMIAFKKLKEFLDEALTRAGAMPISHRDIPF